MSLHLDFGNIELVAALLILSLHFAFAKNLARACYVASKFLYIWYWGVAIICIFIALPVTGIFSLLGAGAGCEITGGHFVGFLGGVVTGGTLGIVFMIWASVFAIMCLVGAYLLKTGTNFASTDQFDRAKIVIGAILILVPAVAYYVK